MATKSGLGRGLSALLPDESLGPFRQIAVTGIRRNKWQPREQFDDDALEVLTDSVRRFGILQPLIVREVEGEYELVAGERRLRAARQAGFDTVPVIVKDIADSESLESALVENLHREDLNALEEAAAFRQLIDDFDLTHEAVAQRLSKSRAAVTNGLRLLTLPGQVQEMVVDRRLSGGHARALVSIDDPATQIDLAERVVADGLSVRQTEVLAKNGPIRPKRRKNGHTVPKHPALLEVGELLGEFLNTPVDVDLGKKSGKMIIEFGSLSDLERIAGLILGHIDS